MDTVGCIFNVQHFSVDDGPGIRTTVFMKGCPLRCAWCHNPESWRAYREILFYSDRCIMCGACASACPNGAHVLSADSHIFDRERCAHSCECADACLVGALETVGRDVSVGEVMREILADRAFYNSSGGGVTLSGGEPTAQPRFATVLLAACKAEGLDTAIETCGYASREVLLGLLPYTDVFLFDYKLTDPEKHKRYTGVSNAPILENLDALCGAGARIILRCPMIPEVNIEQSHFDGMVSLAKKYKNIEQIQLEPYHPMGISKSEALGAAVGYDRRDFLDASELDFAVRYVSERVSVPVSVN